MLRNFFSDEPTDVEDQIEAIKLEMTKLNPTSDEYATLVKHLTALDEIKTKNRRKPVSSDTIFIVAGNAALAVMIMGFERTHVTISKAFSMFHRPKGL